MSVVNQHKNHNWKTLVFFPECFMGQFQRHTRQSFHESLLLFCVANRSTAWPL